MALRPLATLLAICTAWPLAAADLNFCWQGANGYTMTGKMEFPDALMSHAVLTEQHVTRFKISGYQNGTLIGSWDSRDAAPGATFHLRFDPVAMRFLTGGSFPGTFSQGWNADGTAANCGQAGFGFNSGNYAQDFCLDGAWISDSSIDPATPLLATTSPVAPDCSAGFQMSKAAARHSD